MPADPTTTLGALRARAARFVRERDWEQYHLPKNLAMGLAIEAGELMEQFLWATPEATDAPDETTRRAVEDELADVLMFVLHLANRLDIDITDAFYRKLAQTERRYPADLVRGRADKYTTYQRGQEG